MGPAVSQPDGRTDGGLDIEWMSGINRIGQRVVLKAIGGLKVMFFLDG